MFTDKGQCISAETMQRNHEEQEGHEGETRVFLGAGGNQMVQAFRFNAHPHSPSFMLFMLFVVKINDRTGSEKHPCYP